MIWTIRILAIWTMMQPSLSEKLFMPVPNVCAKDSTEKYVLEQIELNDRVMAMHRQARDSVDAVVATCPDNFAPVVSCEHPKSSGLSFPTCPAGFKKQGWACEHADKGITVAKCPSGYAPRELCERTEKKAYTIDDCENEFVYKSHKHLCTRALIGGMIETAPPPSCPGGFDLGWFFAFYCYARPETAPNCPLGFTRQGWACTKDRYSELASCPDGYQRAELCDVDINEATHDPLPEEMGANSPCRPGFMQRPSSKKCHLHEPQKKPVCPNGESYLGNWECSTGNSGNNLPAGCPFGYHPKTSCDVKGPLLYSLQCESGYSIIIHKEYEGTASGTQGSIAFCEKKLPNGKTVQGPPLQCKPGFTATLFLGIVCVRQESKQPSCPDGHRRVGWTCLKLMIDIPCPPLSFYDEEKKTCDTATQPYVCDTRTKSPPGAIYLPTYPTADDAYRFGLTPCMHYFSDGCTGGHFGIQAYDAVCFPGFHIRPPSGNVPASIPFDRKNYWFCILDEEYGKCPHGWTLYRAKHCLRNEGL